MASFTSGSSWVTAELFRTFSEVFPQYTSPGIWIAAEERLHQIKIPRLVWDAATRTVKLSILNSRRQTYTLAMHFYPGAVCSAKAILRAAEAIAGLPACLRTGEFPPILSEAIAASGEDVFMRKPGAIEFDTGMMASECALLIAAFLADLEKAPNRWFSFIGLDFTAGSASDPVTSPAAQEPPAAPAAPAPLRPAVPEEPPYSFEVFRHIARALSGDIPIPEVPAIDPSGIALRLRLWQPQPVPLQGLSCTDALPASGLSALHARTSWCAFSDAEAKPFMVSLLNAAAHAADEALVQLARREARQDKTGTVTANAKWVKFVTTVLFMPSRSELPQLSILGGIAGSGRLDIALREANDPEKLPGHALPAQAAFGLLALTRRELAGLPDEFAIWRALALAAAQILAARAVVPVPVLDECASMDFTLAVRWMPSMGSPEAVSLLGSVIALTGPAILSLPAGKPWQSPLGKCFKTPAEAVLAVVSHFITELVIHTATANREVARSLIGRRLRGMLTGEGFAPDPLSADNLSSVTAAFFALPLAAAGLPVRIVIAGNIENDLLALRVLLEPREALPGEEKQQLTLDGWEALGKDPKHAVRETLRLLAASHPPFGDFGSGFDQPARYARQSWEVLIYDTLPRLSHAGITVLLPEQMQKIEKPRIVLTAAAPVLSPAERKRLATQGMLNAAALADFKWEIAIGNERLSLAELRRRIDEEGSLLVSGSALFHLTREELEKLANDWLAAQEKPMSRWDKLRALLSGNADGCKVEAADELLERLRETAVIKELPQPPGLRAVLRPYQVRGFSWLVQNTLLGIGSLLADDMGLGKTVQVIAAITELKDRGELKDGKVLIAAPASLLVNWQREIERFAPSLTARIYHGKERTAQEKDGEQPDVLITSYGLLKRELEKLSQHPFRLLVLDEAQAVKNARTGQARAAQEFPAETVIALTGTPVENRLSEYWSIFSIVEPGLLGTPVQFRRDFVEPIEERRDQEAIERFRRITAPFLLRRVKTDPGILDELPEKNIVDYFTTLTARQVALYEQCLRENLETLESLDGQAEQSTAAGDRFAAARARLSRRGQILRMILSLKQISNSPSQYLKEYADKPDSGKAEALLELLRRCRQSGRKALIFTQFREMGERLVRWIEDATGKRPEFLHGSVPAAKRMEMVDAFQSDPDSEVFVLSLKAGGTGLNLTAASAVIHYDLWWNPAVEDQASDRAWRIGQRRDVVVYRFITAGTFEEKVNEMLKKKRELAGLAVGVGESWIGDLTDEEIRSVFTLSAG